MKSSLHLLHGKTHQRIVNWQVGQLLVIQVAFLWRDVIRSTVRADLRCHWGFLQLLKDSPFSLSFLLEWSSMHAYERDSDLYGRFPKSWFSDIKKKKNRPFDLVHKEDNFFFCIISSASCPLLSALIFIFICSAACGPVDCVYNPAAFETAFPSEREK